MEYLEWALGRTHIDASALMMEHGNTDGTWTYGVFPCSIIRALKSRSSFSQAHADPEVRARRQEGPVQSKRSRGRRVSQERALAPNTQMSLSVIESLICDDGARPQISSARCAGG